MGGSRSVLKTTALLTVMAVAIAASSSVAPSAGAAGASTAELPPGTTPADCTVAPPMSSDPYVMPAWSDATGWTDPGQYQTIMVGDVNGDGRSELLGRNGIYLEVDEWAPPLEPGGVDPGRWMTVASGPMLPNDDGWDEPQLYETIELADLDGDGDDEVVARDNTQIVAFDFDFTVPATGTVVALPDGPKWSDVEGDPWIGPQYTTFQTGDVDGNGTDDVLALYPGNSLMVGTSYDAGSGTWQSLPDLAIGSGWGDAQYYSTIQLADLDGDGADEVLARGNAGIVAWKLVAGVWTSLPAGPAWSDAAGWDQPEQYETIQTGDVDGDGADELLGLSDLQLETYRFDGGAWVQAVDSLAAFPSVPWGQEQYFATIQTGDVDGDGAADLLARSPDGLDTYSVQSGAWVPMAATFSALSDSAQFDTEVDGVPVYALTIDAVPVLTGQPEVLIARSFMGVNTWSLTGAAPSATWGSSSSPFPAWAQPPVGTPDALSRAYQYINDQVGKALWPDDTLPDGSSVPILTKFQDLTQSASAIEDQLSVLKPRGLNVSRADWDTVLDEMEAWTNGVVDLVTYYYGQGDGPSLQSLAADQLMLSGNYLTAIKEQYFEIGGTEEILAIVSTILGAAVAAGAGLLDPADYPLLIVALSALGSGLSSWQGFLNPEGAIDATYDELVDKVNDAFCSATFFLDDSYGQIVSDYGMLATVSQLVGSGTWGWSGTSFDTAVAEMALGQQLWSFQQFAPVAWRAGHCQPNALGDVDCLYGVSDDYVELAGTQVGNDFTYWKVVGTLEGGVDCRKSESDSLAFLVDTLGVDLWDVFTPLQADGQAVDDHVGSNGWTLKVDNCAG